MDKLQGLYYDQSAMPLDDRRQEASELCVVCGAVLKPLNRPIRPEEIEEMIQTCGPDCESEFIKDPEKYRSDDDELE